MREIVNTLERNAREVQYGSVSVELRIHEGQVVKEIYRTGSMNAKHAGSHHPDRRPAGPVARQPGGR